MPTYNGHRNWAHWNVSLWLANDEHLYSIARNIIARYPRALDSAARHLLGRLKDEGITQTPDGATYTLTSVRAALRGL